VLLACLLVTAMAAPAIGAEERDLSRPGADAGPTQIRISFYLVDLHEVTGADQTFHADVVVEAEWMDARLAGRYTSVQTVPLVEVWNPRLALVNQKSVVQLFPERVQVEPSGLVHWGQRWLGSFSTRMDLRDFPMDHQRFEIRVASLGYSRDKVELITKTEKSQSTRAKSLSITDWEIGPATSEIADFETAPGEAAYSGALLRWEGRRYVRYYVFQSIIPLVLIVLMGWLTFFVHASVVPARMSVAMTTMLTLISYRFALGRSVPTLTYLTRFDYFMLASTVLVFVILVVVSLEAYLVSREKVALCNRIDFWARCIFPVIFGIVFVFAWWGNR
jgi:gamma-aminobutyric acid receptor subunit beta